MSTINKLISDIINRLPADRKNIPNNEIVDLLLDNFRFLQDTLPVDIYVNSLNYKIVASTGVNTLSCPADFNKLVGILVQENNGEYFQWHQVSPNTLDNIKHREDDMGQDSTSTRIFCVAPTLYSAVFGTNGWLLYPTPISGRNIKIIFLKSVTEADILTTPQLVQDLVKLKTLADLVPEIPKYNNDFAFRLNTIISKWTDRNKLTNTARSTKQYNSYWG